MSAPLWAREELEALYARRDAEDADAVRAAIGRADAAAICATAGEGAAEIAGAVARPSTASLLVPAAGALA